MTKVDGPIAEQRGGDHREGGPPPLPDPGGTSDIVADATRPGVDPCDVACDAMPGYLVGDLSSAEVVWLRDHAAGCGYCADALDGYQRVDALLDDVACRLDAAAPPLIALPSPRPASYGRVESPVGPLYVAVSDAGVCEIGFAAAESEAAFRGRLVARGFAPRPETGAAVERVAEQLGEYFGGRRDRFELPLDLAGVSPFTRSVLAATAEVPFGQLLTYAEIARRVGRPRATRAVGNALGRNPIPVIVPCHRIVRSDASLGGYTGGLGIKERLLAIEGVAVPRRRVAGTAGRTPPFAPPPSNQGVLW